MSISHGQKLVTAAFKEIDQWMNRPGLNGNDQIRYLQAKNALTNLVKTHKQDFFEAVSQHEAVQQENLNPAFGSSRLLRLISTTLGVTGSNSPERHAEEIMKILTGHKKN